MSHLSSFSTFIVERLLSSILSFINRSRCSVSLLNHNGHSIWEYPERNWKLVPFPDQKGNPFNADNLATVNRHSFLDDPDFKRSRAAAQARWEVSIAPRDISWRLHVILWAFGLAHKNHVSHNSIYVELGTGRGYMAAAICEYYSLQDFSSPFYLIDTFTQHLALSSNLTVQSPAHFAYSDGDKEVRRYFARYPFVHLLTGLVPDILVELPNLPILFLHVDLNNSDAENLALDTLMPFFISGTVIVFDDYGGPGGTQQAKVHEEFAACANRKLLVLPTGQAILIW